MHDINLDPTDIVKNLPKFDLGAFHIEYFDVESGLRNRALLEGEFQELPLNAESQKISKLSADEKSAYYKKIMDKNETVDDTVVKNINGVNVSATEFALQDFIK